MIAERLSYTWGELSTVLPVNYRQMTRSLAAAQEVIQSSVRDFWVKEMRMHRRLKQTQAGSMTPPWKCYPKKPLSFKQYSDSIIKKKKKKN